MLPIPAEVRRAILVANVAHLDMSRLDCMPGGPIRNHDLLLEFNRAPHKEELDRALAARNVNPIRYLVVRHRGYRVYNAPATPDGYDHVMLTSRRCGMANNDWFMAYRRATGGKVPTTGHAMWLMLRATTTLQLVLWGYNPTGDHTSEHCPAHDWDYEAKVYRREGALLV